MRRHDKPLNNSDAVALSLQRAAMLPSTANNARLSRRHCFRFLLAGHSCTLPDVSPVSSYHRGVTSAQFPISGTRTRCLCGRGDLGGVCLLTPLPVGRAGRCLAFGYALVCWCLKGVCVSLLALQGFRCCLSVCLALALFPSVKKPAAFVCSCGVRCYPRMARAADTDKVRGVCYGSTARPTL